MEQSIGLKARNAEDTHLLTFGIFPGSVAGTETSLAVGPEEDPQRTLDALDLLQGEGKQLLVRSYIPYTGPVLDDTFPYSGSPLSFETYLSHRRKLDLVLSFRHDDVDLSGWLRFVQGAVRRFGLQLAKLQITSEPNFTRAPASADGCFVNVLPALVQGVIAAKEEALRNGYDVQIGFNVVAGPIIQEEFWSALAALGGANFRAAVDYVGLNTYPDVFSPIELGHLPGFLSRTVEIARTVHLPIAQIPASVPLHITENGWPTGPNRSYESQALVIETNVRTIHALQGTSNVTHYELFMLRDVHSANPNRFYQFGLLHDDYTPKPAFATYRRLIAELGATL